MVDTKLAQRRRLYERAAYEQERADMLRGLAYGLTISCACWVVIGLLVYAIIK